MKYNAIPTSCETFTWGEVEDYTVNLSAASGGDTQAPSVPANLLTSNPTNTTMDLTWNASTDNVGVTGYDVFVGGTNIGSIVGTAATITGLVANTTYDFNVRAFDAAGNTSALSNTATGVTTGGGGGAGVIAGYYFETGLEGWSDGGSDCARQNYPARSYEGNYSVRLRDNSSTSYALSPILDLSGNNQVTIEFHTYANSMEVGEDFFVEFFNGSTFQVIGNYARGADFNNGAFFTDTILLDAGTYNFNSNNRFRIRCDASANNDQIYFDQVIVSGDNVTAAPFRVIPRATQAPIKAFTDKTISNVKLYPNPTTSVLNIEILEGSFDEIMVFSTTGQLVRTIKPTSDNLTMDVSEFASGMYFVRFVSGGLAVTKRFIKE